MTLRVLIDAHMMGSGETGNETYVVNLLQHLSQLSGVKCGAALTPDDTPPSDLPGVDLVPLRLPGNWLRLLHALPSACRNWEADLVHVTYVGPFSLPCPMVVTVHDVSFKRYPAFFSPRDRLLFATLLPVTLRRSSAVVTVSQHSKQEILDVYPFLDGKVYVTPEAPSSLFRPTVRKEWLNTVRARYGICSEFILAVGNLQPRKNLLRLIRAFASIRQEMEAIQLVIVGKAQWQSSAVYAEVRRLGVEQDVKLTGYVPDDDLVLLYNAAQVFVYPSIYEGFGLPILEAMACGTPVVASNTSSMPEIAGTAAILVDPYQVNEIQAAIQRILSDPDLSLSLSQEGLKRAEAFSWLGTARDTLQVYTSLITEGR